MAASSASYRGSYCGPALVVLIAVLGSVALLSLPAIAAADNPAVTAVAFSSQPNALRVRITTTAAEPPEVEVLAYTKPDRLILQLPGFEWRRGSTLKARVGRNGVSGIRAGQYQADPPMTRVVLDLFGSSAKASYKIITSPGSGVVEIAISAPAPVVAPVVAPAPVEVAPPKPAPALPKTGLPASEEPAAGEAAPDAAAATANVPANPPLTAAHQTNSFRRVALAAGGVVVLLGISSLTITRLRRRRKAEPAETDLPAETQAVEVEVAETAPPEPTPEEAPLPIAEAGGRRDLREDPSSLGMALEDEDPEVRTAAVNIIASMTEKGQIEPVLGYLRSHDPKVRSAVVTALGRLGVVERAGALAALISDPEPAVRASVMEAFRDFGSAAEYYVEMVATRLADSDPEVRARAIEALSALAPESLEIPRRILPLFSDPNPQVADSASCSLVGFARRGMDAALVDLLEAADDREEVFERLVRQGADEDILSRLRSAVRAAEQVAAL